MTDALRETVGAAGGTVAKIEYLDPRTAPTPGGGRSGCSGWWPAPAGEAPTSTRCCCREGGDQLKQIARQLKAAGASEPTRCSCSAAGCGTTPRSAGEPALYGGWFAASPPEPRREFESRFQATYGHSPPRLASLAFDAAALAAVLAKARARPVLARGDPQPERVYRRRRAVPLHATGSGAARLGRARSDAGRNQARQPGAAELPRPRLLTVARGRSTGSEMLPLLAKAAALG